MNSLAQQLYLFYRSSLNIHLITFIWEILKVFIDKFSRILKWTCFWIEKILIVKLEIIDRIFDLLFHEDHLSGLSLSATCRQISDIFNHHRHSRKTWLILSKVAPEDFESLKASERMHLNLLWNKTVPITAFAHYAARLSETSS